MSQPEPTDNASAQTQLDVVRLQRAVASLTHDVRTLSRELAQSLLEREELTILRGRMALMTIELDAAREKNTSLAAAAELAALQTVELQNQVLSLTTELEQAKALQNVPEPSKLSQLKSIFSRV